MTFQGKASFPLLLPDQEVHSMGASNLMRRNRGHLPANCGSKHAPRIVIGDIYLFSGHIERATIEISIAGSKWESSTGLVQWPGSAHENN